MSTRSAILTELGEWHDEPRREPRDEIETAELIALAQLGGAPMELQDRAALILCPSFA